jgi:hypothetical protein
MKIEVTEQPIVNLDALKKIGNEWMAGGKHRIYFNDLTELFGLDYGTFKSSGRVSGATLDGERISNTRAEEIRTALSGKIYYDVTDGRFYSRDIGSCRDFERKELVNAVVDEIKRRAS